MRRLTTYMEELEYYDYEADGFDENMVETYTEVADTDEDSWTSEDTLLILGLGVGLLLVIAVVVRIIKKNFKNLHIKVGKVEVNLETKDNK